MNNYIVYYRVSTKKQGISGLGLSAQKTIVDGFLKSKNNSVVINEYTDIETGTNKKVRTELQKAINEAKKTSSTLLIAKLDRLSRNVQFISELMNSQVDFIACDMPEANKFTIHIFSALAEQEAELISQRTKSALQELKLKGVKLGNPQNLDENARKKSVEVRVELAKTNENNRRATELIILLREKGFSYRKITQKLNDNGYLTSRGNIFGATQVEALYKRTIIN